MRLPDAGFVGWAPSVLALGPPERHRGRQFDETACHALDLVDHLSGPASDAAGVACADAPAVSASYRFADAIGSGVLGGRHPDTVEVTIVGRHGVLSFAQSRASLHPARRARGEATYQVGDPAQGS